MTQTAKPTKPPNHGRFCFAQKEIDMLKSCSYCGRVHDSKYACPMRPKQKKKKRTEVNRFRWSRRWAAKRTEIKRRDLYLCQVCLRELYRTRCKYNCDDLEVHHIVPLSVDFERRLDSSNLITLCSFHHGMAEYGGIPADELLGIVNHQTRYQIKEYAAYEPQNIREH